MKTLLKINISFFIGLVLSLYSCDMGTDEYYMYSNNADYETYFLWGEPSQCCPVIYDTTIKYDALKLFFPSDKSTINSHCETYYNPVKDTNGVTIDSVQMCCDCFKIDENDPRVLDNKFVILNFIHKNAIIRVDTLHRTKEKITLLDKLPLPKLH